MSFFTSGYQAKVARSGVAVVCASIVVLTLAGPLYASLISQDTPRTRTYYATQNDERWFVSLETNLTITMNSSSRIVVHPPGYSRRVDLLSGEALFRANRMSQALQLTIGGVDITALRATFDVRQNQLATEVTIIDGKITLQCTCFDAMTPGIVLTAGDHIHIDPEHFERRVLTRRDREDLVAWNTISN
jgi:ferric-dicitrate binding protein FerR (iron transport regulator)